MNYAFAIKSAVRDKVTMAKKIYIRCPNQECKTIHGCQLGDPIRLIGETVICVKCGLHFVAEEFQIDGIGEEFEKYYIWDCPNTVSDMDDGWGA